MGKCFHAKSVAADAGFLAVPAIDLILNPAEIDFGKVVADLSAIQKLLPQRHEMEQLTAILIDDPEDGIIAGYKDIAEDEFWVRGHMPGMPLMPGVIMCEAAAQVCSYHVIANRLMETDMLGFGGLDEVRFRGPVTPGDRLLVVAERQKLRPKTIVLCRFQCFVGDTLVCDGRLRGIPIPVNELRKNDG
ncbi:MAG: 3-hydroxyacyl-ACP dehydratase FabZ family protein [Planctomycetota bacterium]